MNGAPAVDESEFKIVINGERYKSVVAWLLDADPAIRWQVMRDLTDEPAAAVARERSRVATEGWGARLLDLQAADGNWGGVVWSNPGWTATHATLQLLRDLGIDPADERVRTAINLVRDKCDWGPEWNNSPYFEGEVEACINGRVLAQGAYFGVNSDRLAERFLGEQMEDGGWNCYTPPSRRSSFHSTICVLEGLLEYENMSGATVDVTAARLRGQEYLLERRLFRSLSTSEVVNPAWLQFSFPTRWHYDVLWGLDYMRKAGVRHDDRIAEAIDLVDRKRSADGTWLLDNVHEGQVHFEVEDPAGSPSRWNTLRALRVLRWFDCA